jgi:N4-gp56 family major capsid protein
MILLFGIVVRRAKMFKFNKLQMFAEGDTTHTQTYSTENTTTSESLKTTIKEHWLPTMLDNVRTELFHTQFAKKETLPKKRGKKVEWRKWNTFDPDLEPLVEGVTPEPQAMGQSAVYANVEQFGNWVPITDMLEFAAFDNTILGATDELSAQAGETMDIYARNVLVAGTMVEYASKKTFATDGTVTKRTAVTSRSAIDSTCVLDDKEVHKAVTILRKRKAPKINGNYVGIIHPSVEFDLTESKGWRDAHIYASPDEIYNGEIGKLRGCRFVVSNNAKVWGADDASTGTTAVYPCLFFGKDAYACVEPSGGTLQMYIKLAKDSGTDDPLEQRNTVGYKFSTACAILQEERLLRLECASSEFGSVDETN